MQDPAKTTEHLLSNIAKLKVKPPISSNSIRNFDPSMVGEDAANTHIVVHPRFPSLVEAFLAHKRKHGSKYEKELYSDSDKFTWRDEVKRLIEKRPLVFMGAHDHTVLRDGTMLQGSTTREWDRNGTAAQTKNTVLKLDDYLSYDEIMLGSLVGVSGPSFFLNDGNRYNNGRRGATGTFRDRGIIIGLVGARFERASRMDSIFVLRTPSSSLPPQHPALTKIFETFFGQERNPDVEFNVEMYKARIRISADVLLLEAHDRAAEAEGKAYVYVVGLGLGVWQYNSAQARYYVEAFGQALEELDLAHIGTVEFGWINSVPDPTMKTIVAVGARKDIKVIFSRRNPAEKLETDELLVLSYAWDGNAFPGKE